MKDTSENKPGSSRKTSRKALEYRVYWLERKLTLQQSDQLRAENIAKIENLPASPMKELLHLNNEFQRANEQARGLKELTQEINNDTLKANERGQRINEVVLGKIADTERINQQSKRLQERTRKINNETVKTATVARQINQNTKAAITKSEKINEETRYLNGLSQAQHNATDRLNRRTEQVNLHGIEVANKGLKLNEVLLKTQAESETSQSQSVVLHTIMKRTRTEFMALNEEARVLRQETDERFESIDELAQVCQQAVLAATQVEKEGQAMLDRSDILLAATDELNEASNANLQKFAGLAQQTEQLITHTQTKTRALLDHQTQAFDSLQSGVRDDFTSLQSETDAALHEWLAQADQSLLELEHDVRSTHVGAAEQVMLDHQRLEYHLRETAKTQTKEIGEFAARTSSQLTAHVDAMARESEDRVAQVVAQTQAEASVFDAVARRSIADILAKTDIDGRHSLQTFEAQADKTLRITGERIAGLESRAVQALDETAAFLAETTQMNDASRQILHRGESLNISGVGLQQRCIAALNEIDVAMSELKTCQSTVQRDADSLALEAKTHNQQSQTQYMDTEELNEQARQIQQDSVRTQELSQEINDHSLELHIESRKMQLAFDNLNDDNQSLLQHLTRLREQLNEQIRLSIEHQAQSSETQASAVKTNADATNLNAETRLLNDQTLNIIADARSAVRETQGLNKSALLLAYEIRETRREMEQVAEETLLANAASIEVTAEARQTIIDSHMMQQNLASSADHMNHLQSEASLELDRLQELRVETSNVTDQSKKAFIRLETFMDNAEQINDDFLRGLEAANRQHSQTEAQAQGMLSETQKLQSEMQNILSLREGISEFRANADRCQVRLDQYSEVLSACQNATTTHSDLFTEYQDRLEQYQADTQGYRDAVQQFDSRTRRLESFFKDYDQRLDSLEAKSQADGQFEKLNAPQVQRQLQDQAEQLQRFERLIREELDAGSTALQATIVSIQDHTRLELERTSKQLLQQFNQTLQGSTQTLNQDMSLVDARVQALSTDHETLDLKIQRLLQLQQHNDQQQAQQQAQQEAQQEAQHQGVVEQQAQRQTQQTETTRALTSVRDQVEEIKHRLGNYQVLLETQMDNDESEVMAQRIIALEARIDDQQSQLQAQTALYEARPQAQAEDVQQMTAMISEFSQAMDKAVATNDALKLSIGDSAATSEDLLNTNKQLQARLYKAVKEQAKLTRDYDVRIADLESREAKVANTVADVKERTHGIESDTDKTMQQMRLAMKESTRAMRDTQKTLERLQQPIELTPTTEPEKPRRWAQSSRQAVLSSMAAVVLTAASMFGILGYQNVDAALPLANQLHNQRPASLLGLNSLYRQQTPDLTAAISGAPLEQTGFVEPSLDSLFQARDSISRLGEFAWPLNSGIVDTDNVQYRPYHQGITIQAELGDPIVAVNDGEVIYSANEIRGYGNVIVIQHDDSLLSVYANNQFNYVQQGDTVRRGQLIGDVGQLFEEKTAGLYFEMRYEGAAQDPFNYLAESLQANSSS
jgi:murein DD-endopeptidase MepM/ murein hydrolase activator NlpD